MNKAQQIPCPDCETPIYFDFGALGRGEKFSCNNCGIQISISTETREEMQRTIDKLEGKKLGLVSGSIDVEKPE